MSHDHVLQEVPTGDIDGSNTEFVLPQEPTVGTVRFFVNGVEQKLGTDFTVSGSTITTTTAPRAADGDNPADTIKAHYEVAV